MVEFCRGECCSRFGCFIEVDVDEELQLGIELAHVHEALKLDHLHLITMEKELEERSRVGGDGQMDGTCWEEGNHLAIILLNNGRQMGPFSL